MTSPTDRSPMAGLAHCGTDQVSTGSAAPPRRRPRWGRMRGEIATRTSKVTTGPLVPLTLQPQFVVGEAFVLMGACSGLARSSPVRPVGDVLCDSGHGPEDPVE